VVVGAVVAAAVLSLPVLVIVLPIYLGYLLLRRGRKHSVESGEAELARDARSPVLYLRSFQDEEAERSILYRFRQGLSDKTWLADTTPNNGIQEQDALGYIFRKIGPYIALGKPGETLPELGSAKIYAANENWQQKIRHFLATSRLIIFRAGRTEGLKWELQQIVQTVQPVKFVLLLPAKPHEYASFTQWANGVMPVAFPEAYPDSRIVVFDHAWTPSYVPRGRTLTKSFQPLFTQNGIAIRESFWERFLEHNGLRW
jgi:hypothetical protein